MRFTTLLHRASMAFWLCIAAIPGGCTTGDSTEAASSQRPPEASGPVNAPNEVEPIQVEDDCPALLDGLVSLRMISQGSHAAARHDLKVELASGALRGDSYDLNDGDSTPHPRAVDRTLTSEEKEALLATLRGICHPVHPAASDEHGAPGGSTIFELERSAEPTNLKLVFGQGASNLAAGDRFIDLSREEFSQLAQRIPTR